MTNRNTSLVTSDLFLDLEFVLYHQTQPTIQTIVNLNEIIELVVLKEKLIMPFTDYLVIVKNLNWQEIQETGGWDYINWYNEIKNLGKEKLKKPIITSFLSEKGILSFCSNETKDKDYENFDLELAEKQWKPSYQWMLKTIGLDKRVQKLKQTEELIFLRGFNNTIRLNADPLFWKMLILAAPDLNPELKSKYGFDYYWTYQFYKEIEIYTKFAKRKGLEFSDNIFLQPFIALNFQPSKTFIDVFYKKLKDVRNEEIKQFLGLQVPWVLYLPPLTLILLQRCKTIMDLPQEIIKLRTEFKSIREALTKFQKTFEQAKILKEQIKLKKEFQNSVNLFIHKVRDPRKRIIKTIIDFAIEKSDSVIKKDFGGPIKDTVGKLAEYIYYRKLYPWNNSFLHLYDKSLEIKSDVNIYEKLFGKINFDYFDEFKLFAQNSQKLLENP